MSFSLASQSIANLGALCAVPLRGQVVKEMLREWERKSPGRTEIMFRALQNVVPSQLADRNLFDFKSLRIDNDATPRFVDVMSL